MGDFFSCHSETLTVAAHGNTVQNLLFYTGCKILKLVQDDMSFAVAERLKTLRRIRGTSLIREA